MALNFKVETVKGKIFTTFLITALVGTGLIIEANMRATVLQDRLNQQEQLFMDLANEYHAYMESVEPNPIEDKNIDKQ
jgi:hypothetical protein